MAAPSFLIVNERAATEGRPYKLVTLACALFVAILFLS